MPGSTAPCGRPKNDDAVPIDNRSSSSGPALSEPRSEPRRGSEVYSTKTVEDPKPVSEAESKSVRTINEDGGSAKTFIEGCSCPRCLEEKRRQDSLNQHHSDCECKKCMEERKKETDHHKTCQCPACMEERDDLKKEKCPSAMKRSSSGRPQTPPPLPARDFSDTDLTSAGEMSQAVCRSEPRSKPRQEVKRPERRSEFMCPRTSNNSDEELERMVDRKIDEFIRPLLKSIIKGEKATRFSSSEPRCPPKADPFEVPAFQFKSKRKPCPPLLLEDNNDSSMGVPSCCEPKRKPYSMRPPMGYGMESSCSCAVPQKYHSEASCASLYVKKSNKNNDCPATAFLNFDDAMSCKSCTSDDDDY